MSNLPIDTISEERFWNWISEKISINQLLEFYRYAQILNEYFVVNHGFYVSIFNEMVNTSVENTIKIIQRDPYVQSKFNEYEQKFIAIMLDSMSSFLKENRFTNQEAAEEEGIPGYTDTETVLRSTIFDESCHKDITLEEMKILDNEQEDNISNSVLTEEPTYYFEDEQEPEFQTEEPFEIIDFDNFGNVSFSQPISVKYFGIENKVDSWCSLFDVICSYLQREHPDVFLKMCIESIHGEGALWIVDEEHKSMLRVPQYLGGGYYVEVNRSAIEFLRQLKKILTRCNIDYHDIIIRIAHSKISKNETDSFEDIISQKKKDIQDEPVSEIISTNNGNIDFISNPEKKFPSFQTESNFEQKFFAYLKDERYLAESSCRGYISSIHSAEKYAKEHNYSSVLLLTDNSDDAEQTFIELINDPEFIKMDRKNGTRFTNALNKLMSFHRSKESEKFIVNSSNIADAEQPSFLSSENQEIQQQSSIRDENKTISYQANQSDLAETDIRKNADPNQNLGTENNSTEEKEIDIVTKKEFRDYLKTKGYKDEIAVYNGVVLQQIANRYEAPLFETDIETMLHNVAVVNENLNIASQNAKNKNEAFTQLERILNILRANNMLAVYAKELDQFIYERYNISPETITAPTFNGIGIAWKNAQKSNNSILTQTDTPLLFSRIAQEFPKVSFIGDIEISDDEYKLLIYYFRHIFDLERFSSNYKMEQDPFLAVILVQIGIRYYNMDFWPDVSRELGLNLDGLKQSKLRQNFISVLDRYGKIYLDKDNNIQNIMLHGFISNYFAPGFFENLYRYYRIDLHSNLENNTDEMFSKMLSRISENKNIQFKVQTKYAVQNNPKRSAEIIKELLYLLDIGFHDNEFHDPETRLHRLLNQWMTEDAFQIDLQKEVRSRTAYQKRYSQPYLQYDSNYESMQLIIPHQMVDDDGQENLIWVIKTNHGEIHQSVDILEDSKGITGIKTDNTAIPLPISQWFDNISITGIDPSTGTQLAELNCIPEDPVRFFDSSFMSRNPNHMPTGDLTVLVKKGYSIKSNALVDCSFRQAYDIAYLNLEEGDIIHISNGKYYIAGQKFVEGIARSTFMRDIVSEEGGKMIPIVTTLPEIRFKVKPEMIMGMVIYANNNRYSVRNNPPAEIDLGTGEEEKGFEISLKDYLPDEAGKYQIALDFSDQRHNRGPFEFIYLPQFSCKFNYEPYIFQDEGSITFSCKGIEITPQQNDVQLNESGDAYIFPIDKDHLNLEFTAKTNESEISFSIKVPCVRYSFGDNEWFTDFPEFIMTEELSHEILFDIPDDELTVSLSKGRKESETLTKDSNGIFHYQTNAIINYSTRDIDKVDIYLSSPVIQKQFGSPQIFTCVLMKSIIKSKQITYHAGTMSGNIEIVGKGEYAIDIYYLNTLVANNILLVNGKFSLEKNIENGTYQFDIFENVEDDFGLGLEKKKINSFMYELIDASNLTNKSLKINKLLWKNVTGIKSYKIQQNLIIHDLEKASINEDNCYYGLLDRMNVIVRIFFPDIDDLSLAYITYWDEPNKEYFDFEYATITNTLLIEQSDSYPKDLYDRYKLLNCDESDWNLPVSKYTFKTIFDVSVE